MTQRDNREHHIRRVVISADYGGFAVSEEARRLLADRGHPDPDRMPRDHPDLVAVVEQLGDLAGESRRLTKGSSRRPLAIVEIPADIEWVLQEHGGLEWIAEQHRRWDAKGEVPPDRSVRQRGTG